MKLTGFVQEHDDNIPSAIPFRDMFEFKNWDKTLIAKVTDYLNNGAIVFGWMHYVRDFTTGELLCPHGYYTDGEWIWPGYYPLYLKNYPGFFDRPRFNWSHSKREFYQ